jgi:hypothetical protein
LTAIVFNTPGELDLRAFTLMGVSAKPNSKNPIGYFGTGLKYAIATLVRLGAEPVVWIGLEKYTFFKRKGEFRGTEFEKLSMRRESFKLTKPRVTDLPYAVSYGRNWEAWMAFRELESNTRDEGGESFEMENAPDGAPGQTTVVVELEAFTEAFRKRNEIFLEEAQREGVGVQVVDRPNNYLYWRGLRVYKLPKPSLFTYNFLDHMVLTEDRTLDNVYMARYNLASWLVACNSDHVIGKVLQASEKHWEHELEFPTHVSPGRAFVSVMQRYPKRVSQQAWGYYRRYDDTVTERTFKLEEQHPFPWEVCGGTVQDANGKTVFEAPFAYAGKWELTAATILKYLNPVDEEPIIEPEPYEEGYEVNEPGLQMEMENQDNLQAAEVLDEAEQAERI